MHKKSGEPKSFLKKNSRAQVTIFIIIAIVIVAGVAIFLIFRGNLGIGNIPANIQPAYNTFLSCLEDKTKVGIDILESQAGYITMPTFESGNAYMPFSSELNFLGNPIPYWYYVSGNNIQKEQIPSQSEMEESLASFIDAKIRTCNFDSYYQEGFEINQEEPKASVSIKNNAVDVTLKMNMAINFGNDTAVIQTHKATIQSNLGALYNSAKKVYGKEKSESFLENYGIDVMRLYAPVDGVELTCSPKIWNADDIFEELKNAIEVNTLSLSTKEPATKDGKYFFVDAGVSEDVRFISSKNWTNSFEVLPTENNLLISNPVGNQQGLGILGFCYVPYHFVYNVKYPVLIQVSSGEETFQFPVAVVIQGNKPRIALNSTAKTTTSELCSYKNTPATVATYDSSMNAVNSEISYECFGESCNIGTTSSGVLNAEFPQCVNGFVIARANGFQETKYQYSTIQQGSLNIIMNKLYNMNVDLKLDGNNYNGKALIYFNSESGSKAVSYPEQKNVNLSEGNYEISVYIYQNSSIKLDKTTTQECVQVSSSGIGGIFGLTEKKCFDVNVPAQIISSVLSGGGNQEVSIAESSLKNSGTIQINAESFAVPTSMEQVQNNYLIFDGKGLEVNFR
jgi:hypothetical protein